MTTANFGLALFVAVAAANAGGLWLDLVLWQLGLTTVTGRVIANPWLGAALVALQLAGTLGLCLHFFARGAD